MINLRLQKAVDAHKVTCAKYDEIRDQILDAEDADDEGAIQRLTPLLRQAENECAITLAEFSAASDEADVEDANASADADAADWK